MSGFSQGDPRALHNLRFAHDPDHGTDWPTVDDPDQEILRGDLPFPFAPAQLARISSVSKSLSEEMSTLAETQVLSGAEEEAMDTLLVQEKVTTSVVDSHFEIFGGKARPDPLFTGSVDELAQGIVRAGNHAGDLTTPKAKFEWKELNAILGLGARTNDDREQRMLECERREYQYALKVGTNKSDVIETKTYTVSRTNTVQARHNQEQDRTTTTRENKQAKVVKGNLRSRSSTYAEAIWHDYRRLSAFLSTAMKNPVWARSVCIALSKLLRVSGNKFDSKVLAGMRNAKMVTDDVIRSQRVLRHVIYTLSS